MVFGFSSEILENCLFPVSFHMIPIIDLPVTNWIVYAISWSLRVGQCFISDKEVEIFGAAFAREVTARAGTASEETWLVGDSWPTRTSAPGSSGGFGRDRRGKYKRG